MKYGKQVFLVGSAIAVSALAAACVTDGEPAPSVGRVTLADSNEDNDDFDDATEIAVPSSPIERHVSGATVAPTDPALFCAPDYTNSVWYQFTAGVESQIRVTTEGSEFDTALALFTGTQRDLDLLACDDGTGGHAEVSLRTRPGWTYYLMVVHPGTTPISGSDDLLWVDVDDAGESAALVLLDDSDPQAPEIVMLDSLEDGAGDVRFGVTPPVSNNNVWVMGDWNGDGTVTPGVYSQGAFYYTDHIGASNDWSQGFWLGFASAPPRPMVTGRFEADFDNDCIGVIDSNISPVTGDLRFSLRYWCDMGTRPQDPGGGPLLVQFLRSPLGDSQGYTGTHQFAAGDWDMDGFDEIAVRRDQFISFTFTDPGQTADFNHLQLWGVPVGQVADTGVFVSGDWAGSGEDGWGVAYDNDFYYRTEKTYDPGINIYYHQLLPGAAQPPRWLIGDHHAPCESSYVACTPVPDPDPYRYSR